MDKILSRITLEKKMEHINPPFKALFVGLKVIFYLVYKELTREITRAISQSGSKIYRRSGELTGENPRTKKLNKIIFGKQRIPPHSNADERASEKRRATGFGYVRMGSGRAKAQPGSMFGKKKKRV